MQFILTVEDAKSGEPREEVKTLREAMRSDGWPIWLESIKKELDGLIARGIGRKFTAPRSRKDIPSYQVIWFLK